MLRPSNTGQTHDELPLCPTTAANEYSIVYGTLQQPSAPALTWRQAAAEEDNSAPISDDEDSATISDDELVLTPSSIIRAVRSQGFWLFKVEYHGSSLNSAFFGQLLTINNRLSRLAEVANFSGDQCHVKWRSEWVPLFEPELPNDYRTFARRLDAVTVGEDEVRWCSNDSAYTVNGWDYRQHMAKLVFRFPVIYVTCTLVLHFVYYIAALDPQGVGVCYQYGVPNISGASPKARLNPTVLGERQRPCYLAASFIGLRSRSCPFPPLFAVRIRHGHIIEQYVFTVYWYLNVPLASPIIPPPS